MKRFAGAIDKRRGLAYNAVCKWDEKRPRTRGRGTRRGRGERICLMRGKRIVAAVAVAVVLVGALMLVGCSAGGSCFNCMTNAGGCMYDCVAKCNSNELSYYFWSCASFGLLCNDCDFVNNCREKEDQGTQYEESCIGSCYQCGESCRSMTCGGDAILLAQEGSTEASSGYHIAVSYEVEGPTEVVNGVMRTVVRIEVRFGGDGLSFDNVRVICGIGGVESTRWIGRAKSGKVKTVECEFYLDSIEGEAVHIDVFGQTKN